MREPHQIRVQRRVEDDGELEPGFRGESPGGSQRSCHAVATLVKRKPGLCNHTSPTNAEVDGDGFNYREAHTKTGDATELRHMTGLNGIELSRILALGNGGDAVDNVIPDLGLNVDDVAHLEGLGAKCNKQGVLGIVVCSQPGEDVGT